MPALQLVITNLGRNAIINSENDGTNAVKITQIAFGNGTATALSTATALQSEFTRVSTVTGQSIADDMIHVAMYDNSAVSYTASEIGIFLEDGTLFALYAQTSDFIEKSTLSDLYIAFDIKLNSTSTGNITFGDFSFSNPQATQSTMGVAKIALQDDVDEGVDDVKIVTAKKLAVAHYKKAEVDQMDQANKEALELKGMTEGIILPFAGSVVPSNFLECNGACLTRDVYQDLFNAIGTVHGTTNVNDFRLPDLRGEFIRGLDSGRGVDGGRIVGSLQLDELKEHTHVAPGYNLSLPGSELQWYTWQSYYLAANHPTTGVTGGNETRPRNIAMMYCIKY